ncbi:copper homeostasis protein CutC [Streptomyces sp. TRM43335]|uniref:Copper homeostasis protein cutC homolog n=1 Tax=Streptomyces taklimakanensis TaxID=2569853 RepID=A0A6G2BBH6_9ACTN|nr:copper homeostasis protein CutC [Streptomyces taklimakanensis]MTE19610.1 copper homeostasis protein CutC [Streptomyces taklimakanensis]
MSRPILEVIALDARDAVAARDGGADRLELAADMTAGGLTPARETFAAVRDAVDLPVRVMLRATDDFAAGAPEALDDLCGRARALRAEGAEEFVLGFLDDTGAPDLPAIGALLDAVPGCRWTFHRAIDGCADRDVLRKRLDGLPGLDTYLTAGSADGVPDGLEVLCAEAARMAAGDPGYRPLLMAGGGLRLDHVPTLRAAGVTAFHIGGAARAGSWTAPVSPDAVRVWRTTLDAEPAR